MDERKMYQEIVEGGAWDICHTCGAYRWHNLIYCPYCGGIFCMHKHNLFDVIKILKHITFDEGKNTYWAKPKFIVELNSRKIESNKLDKKIILSMLEDLWQDDIIPKESEE